MQTWFLPFKAMIILVEETLKYIEYVDDPQSMPTIVDRITLEMKGTSYATLPFRVIPVAGSKTRIKVISDESCFVVEGFDCIYYVHNNQVDWISKDELFAEAIKETIADDIIVSAKVNGYDTGILKEQALGYVSKAAAIVLKYIDKTLRVLQISDEGNNVVADRQTIRIPYPFEIDLGAIPPGGNYNRIPKCYELNINNEKCLIIVNVLSEKIKAKFRLEQHGDKIPFYSYNWFLSKLEAL